MKEKIIHIGVVFLFVVIGLIFVSSCSNFWTKKGSGGGGGEGGGGTFDYSLGVENIGKTGPAGGIVFFYDAAGFIVEAAPTGTPEGDAWLAYPAHYFEVAPSDEVASAWGGQGTIIPDVPEIGLVDAATETTIGNGRKVTQIIVNYLSGTETDRAAQRCASKTLNDCSDWFLPSAGELNKLYAVKGITGIPENEYWASAQGGTGLALRLNFDTGDWSLDNKNRVDSEDRVTRAIRAF